MFFRLPERSDDETFPSVQFADVFQRIGSTRCLKDKITFIRPRKSVEGKAEWTTGESVYQPVSMLFWQFHFFLLTM
jgi:hypothetical protein